MTGLSSVGWFAIGLVTLLGDPLVIALLALGTYWFGEYVPGGVEADRRAILLATVLGALAVAATLKTGLAVERPADAAALPGLASMPSWLHSTYVWIVGPGGYAMPSGHATAATVGYGGLAWALDRDGRHEEMLAGTLVAIIAASRVALGVHRPSEVLAGIALGAGLLWVVIRHLRDPRRTFLAAGAVGVVALATGWLGTDGLVAAGATLGAALGWVAVGRSDERRLATGVFLAVATVAVVALRRAGGGALLTAGAVVAGVAVVAMPSLAGDGERR